MRRLLTTPTGMNRRHFLQHLAATSAMAGTALQFTSAMQAHADDLKKRHKSAILLWMGGGPSTIDIWDLKPGASTGGAFKPISTTGDLQICEHMPLVAQQMHNLSVVRSMSTREADHNRGRYYMHTGYVPNPDILHPSYGAVIAHELESQSPDLEIPPFVSIGGPSEGPGFLGMTYSPFVVDFNGQVRNLQMGVEWDRMQQRMQMLGAVETSFIRERRGAAAEDHSKVLAKTYQLMTSKQMDAFKVDQEPEAVRQRYGTTGFGRGCLMARRLVETGVSFVEVDLGGWDNHMGVFTALKNRLPEVDQGMSALVEDLQQRGMLEDTAIIWMGEFGRTPRINATAGRDHWARAWSVAVGGAGLKGGIAVGATNEDGTEVDTSVAPEYSSQDLMATVLQSLGIPLDKNYTSLNGRPMKIANSGRVIKELVG